MQQPIDRMLDEVEWRQVEGQADFGAEGELYATHEGELDICGFKFKCYQLNNGQRVFDADSLNDFWGGPP